MTQEEFSKLTQAIETIQTLLPKLKAMSFKECETEQETLLNKELYAFLRDEKNASVRLLSAVQSIVRTRYPEWLGCKVFDHKPTIREFITDYPFKMFLRLRNVGIKTAYELRDIFIESGITWN